LANVINFSLIKFYDHIIRKNAGAIRSAADLPVLAALIGCPADILRATLDEAEACCRDGATDGFGRRFDAAQRLQPPFRAARVTCALFHTQGGLAVDASCRVLARDGRGRLQPLPNLWAAGGAARGVSGNRPSGYLSGNGLLSGLAGGAGAGREAALTGAAGQGRWGDLAGPGTHRRPCAT